MRVFSGMQPSGKFHMGNYQVLTNWLNLQDKHECIFSIVDLHSLTSMYEDVSKLPEYVLNMALDWLSAGLDPEKSTIYVQSAVREHAELHLLLSMMTPISWLERVPSYKEKLVQLGEAGKEINTYGFLGYPELQTADIILYQTDLVPVAEDQLSHLELAREIVRRFNRIYKKTVFKEAKEILTPTLPGIDGRKMSKSYGNGIPFYGTKEEISGKVRLMVTDPKRIKKTDPGDPEICTVYVFHKIFSKTEVALLEKKCKNAEMGCVACKKCLADNMLSELAEIHQKREKLVKNNHIIYEALEYGANRARAIAEKTMQEVRSVMKLTI